MRKVLYLVMIIFLVISCISKNEIYLLLNTKKFNLFLENYLGKNYKILQNNIGPKIENWNEYQTDAISLIIYNYSADNLMPAEWYNKIEYKGVNIYQYIEAFKDCSITLRETAVISKRYSFCITLFVPSDDKECENKIDLKDRKLYFIKNNPDKESLKMAKELIDYLY